MAVYPSRLAQQFISLTNLGHVSVRFENMTGDWPAKAIDIVRLIGIILGLPTSGSTKQGLVLNVSEACYPFFCTLGGRWQSRNV